MERGDVSTAGFLEVAGRPAMVSMFIV